MIAHSSTCGIDYKGSCDCSATACMYICTNDLYVRDTTTSRSDWDRDIELFEKELKRIENLEACQKALRPPWPDDPTPFFILPERPRFYRRMLRCNRKGIGLRIRG